MAKGSKIYSWKRRSHKRIPALTAETMPEEKKIKDCRCNNCGPVN
jgi:hypothetical protein